MGLNLDFRLPGRIPRGDSPLRIALGLINFNECPSLERLLPKLIPISTHGLDEVFCVDGGSQDGSQKLLMNWGVPVHQQISPGRGSAMRDALNIARSDALIFMSTDGNEDVKDLWRFRQGLESGNDLVIASRMMAGARNEEDSDLFRPRKWANKLFNQAANKFFNRSGRFVTDSINGFRAVHVGRARSLNLSASGFTLEYQMTIRAMQKGFRIAEFPTEEFPREFGTTRARSIPTGLRFISCLIRETRYYSERPST